MDFTQPGSGPAEPHRPRARRKNHVIFQSMEAAGVLAHLSDLQGKPKGVPDMATIMATICSRKRPAAEMEELYSTSGCKAGDARDLFHLFQQRDACSVHRKKFLSKEWEPSLMISQTTLRSEDCS